jgi:beta-lactamase class A
MYVLVKTGIRTAVVAGSAVLALTGITFGAVAAQASRTSGQASKAVTPAVTTPICTAPAAHAALAAKLSADIAAVIRSRPSTGHIAVRVEDVKTGVECRWYEGSRSHSASVVKATILAALLYWRQNTHTSLTSTEKYEATLMIEQSDNNAATYLWNDVGHARLQQFVNAATMTETQLSPYGTWGLSNITARDELQLMRLLTEHNTVLSDSSRGYELYLMNHVVSWERWGVPTGAPSGLTVYVKNGWLNDPSLWVINTIGAIAGHGRDYKMAILTYDNPSGSYGEQYGITTVDEIASVANRDLNAGLPAAGTPAKAAILPRAVLGQPDEVLPAGSR